MNPFILSSRTGDVLYNDRNQNRMVDSGMQGDSLEKNMRIF